MYVHLQEWGLLRRVLNDSNDSNDSKLQISKKMIKNALKPSIAFFLHKITYFWEWRHLLQIQSFVTS